MQTDFAKVELWKLLTNNNYLTSPHGRLLELEHLLPGRCIKFIEKLYRNACDLTDLLQNKQFYEPGYERIKFTATNRAFERV